MSKDKSFSIQMVGDTSTISSVYKEELNSKLEKFISDFEENFTQGFLTVDVTYKKGHFGKGRHQGIPLVYTKVRFKTDKGNFFSEKENWGITAALHDTLHTLSVQIREHFKKSHPKVKGNPFLQEWSAIEA